MHSRLVATFCGAPQLKPLTQDLRSSVVAYQAQAAHPGATGANAIAAMPEASSTFGWYSPQRLLSQSEQIPI